MRSDIRLKLLVSQLFVTLLTIGVLCMTLGVAGKELYGALVAALATAASAALLFSYILFSDNYRSLLVMAKIATQIGRGGIPGKAPVSGNDVVVELAREVNDMSSSDL